MLLFFALNDVCKCLLKAAAGSILASVKAIEALQSSSVQNVLRCRDVRTTVLQQQPNTFLYHLTSLARNRAQGKLRKISYDIFSSGGNNAHDSPNLSLHGLMNKRYAECAASYGVSVYTNTHRLPRFTHLPMIFLLHNRYSTNGRTYTLRLSMWHTKYLSLFFFHFQLGCSSK